jgi:hypothetical protein
MGGWTLLAGPPKSPPLMRLLLLLLPLLES